MRGARATVSASDAANKAAFPAIDGDIVVDAGLAIFIVAHPLPGALLSVLLPFGRGWVRVRKLESQNRRPDAVSCFLCIMPHMESTFSDLIGRDCLTPQGDRVTAELSNRRELAAAFHRY